MLHRARPRFVSGAELRAHTAASEQQIASELKDLQRVGFEIETHPHLGHRLVETPDRLMADDLMARRHGTVIGSRILVFHRTASTNDVVARQGAGGGAEGLAVFAESQTAGRGRQGRKWESPAGKGLWFSVLLRPSFGVDGAGRITVAASVAVAQVLRRVGGVDARIKWPNDVTVRGRKLAGILTEWHQGNGTHPYAVLGIGVDVNCRPSDWPESLAGVTTSLLIETGREHDRPSLAAMLLDELDGLWRETGSSFDRIIARWADLNTTLGRQLRLRVGSRVIEGFAQALDGDGALLARRDNGQVERVLSGDVVVEK